MTQPHVKLLAWRSSSARSLRVRHSSRQKKSSMFTISHHIYSTISLSRSESAEGNIQRDILYITHRQEAFLTDDSKERFNSNRSRYINLLRVNPSQFREAIVVCKSPSVLQCLLVSIPLLPCLSSPYFLLSYLVQVEL